VAPDDRSALNNLANEYQSIEDYDRAHELYRRAVDGPGRSNTAFQNLVRNTIARGRYAEALEAMAAYEAAYPDDATLWEWRFWATFVSGDMEGAAALARPVASDPAQPAFVRTSALDHLGQVAYWRGRLDEGRRYFLEAERMAAQVSPSFAWVRRLWTGYSEQVVGDAPWGLAHVREGLRDGTWERLPPLSRAYYFTGLNLAMGGDREGVARVVAGLERSVPPDLQGLEDRLDMERIATMVRAANGERDGVVDALEANIAEFGCVSPRCYTAERAWTEERAGDVGRAIELHEAVRQRGYNFPELNGPYRLRSTLRLGPLYEEIGDTAKAIEAYQRLVEQWADADARGRRLLDHARARLAALAQQDG